MMGHRQVEQAALFYEFSLEKHIPPDHLLRSDRFVDLDELRRELAPFYSNIGRPSVDPELMIRMLLIGLTPCLCFARLCPRRRKNSPDQLRQQHQQSKARKSGGSQRAPAQETHDERCICR